MKTPFRSFAICFTAAGLASACATTPAPATAQASAGAPAAIPTREPPLLEAKLDGIKTTDGKDVDSVMYIADFPPGSVSAHHIHPGWEYNYILKGSITFEVDGQAPYTLKAGQGMFNKRGNVHTVRNASKTEPAQLVSVLIKDLGAPVAVNLP